MPWISTLTCLVIPLLIGFIAYRAIIRQRERMVLRTQHPDEPWLWRRDWAARSAVDLSSSYSGFLWLFAGVWMLISFPLFFIVRDRPRDPFTFVFAIFPAVGVGLLCVAIYQTLRRRKYGVSLCRFQMLPIPLGRTLQGEVDTRVSSVPQDGFVVRLTCLRRIVRRSGKSTSTTERILWQEEQRVGSGGAMPSPDGARVPFRFALPVDAEPTDDSDSRNRVIWRLEVTAEVPGIDYRGVFELPVFTKDASLSGEAVFAPPPEPAWTPSPAIEFGTTNDGSETVTIKPTAPLFDWVFFLAFSAIWYGALALLFKVGVPVWAVAFFALIGTFVLYLALDVLAGRSVITANRTQLVSRRTFFGTRVIPTADIAAVESRIGRTSSTRALYDIEARLNDGRSVTIARYLRNRRDAEQVAERVMRYCGR